MKSLAVLISNAGTGTNLQAIINATKNKSLSAKINVVISSDMDAHGLERAKKNNIPTQVCPDKKLLFPILQKYNPDFICLAGWKLIIPDEVISTYKNKILNLHPGLIPDKFDGKVKNPDKSDALWNKGKLTNLAIENFLTTHSTYAGSSIHFLSDELDFGKVLDRCFEKIKKTDTAEFLYKRLKKKENKMYVNVLVKICR